MNATGMILVTLLFLAAMAVIFIWLADLWDDVQDNRQLEHENHVRKSNHSYAQSWISGLYHQYQPRSTRHISTNRVRDNIITDTVMKTPYHTVTLRATFQAITMDDSSLIAGDLMGGEIIVACKKDSSIRQLCLESEDFISVLNEIEKDTGGNNRVGAYQEKDNRAQS